MPRDDIGLIRFSEQLHEFGNSLRDLRGLFKDESADGKGRTASPDVKIYFRFREPSSSPVTSRENTRICCEAEVDKRPARNAYARESATSESEGMNRSCDKTISRARFLSRGQDFPGGARFFPGK